MVKVPLAWININMHLFKDIPRVTVKHVDSELLNTYLKPRACVYSLHPPNGDHLHNRNFSIGLVFAGRQYWTESFLFYRSYKSYMGVSENELCRHSQPLNGKCSRDNGDLPSRDWVPFEDKYII